MWDLYPKTKGGVAKLWDLYPKAMGGVVNLWDLYLDHLSQTVIRTLEVWCVVDTDPMGYVSGYESQPEI